MSSLFRSSAMVSLMTLLSRILGFARDLLIAAVFGAGVNTDVFFVAFLIPNMFRRIFAEGAFSKGFIPVLNQVKTQEGEQSLKRFVSAIFWRLFVIVSLVVVLTLVFAPYIVPLFAYEFTQQAAVYEQAIFLLRLMFPYLLFISVAAFLTGILNSYQQFTLAAFGPVLLNIMFLIVLGICAYAAASQITWLTWAVLIGGLLHVLILVKPVYQLGLLPSVSWQTHLSVKRVLQLMLPVIVGSSAIQLSQVINTQLNTSVGPGAASWFYYADRLFQFPIGMFGVAIGVVVLPRLSTAVSSAARDDFEHTLEWAIQVILIVALPSALGLWLLAEPISITLYQRGAFLPHDAAMTAKALMAMSLAVIGYMLVQVLATSYYAKQDSKTPAIIGVIAVIVNLIVGVSLIDELGHVATALAISVAAMVNAGLLIARLPEARHILVNLICDRFVLRLVVASMGMVLLLVLMTPDIAEWQRFSQVVRLVWLFGIIALAGMVYAMVLLISGINLRALWRMQ